MRKLLTERHRNTQKTGETETRGQRQREGNKKRERERWIYTQKKKLSHNVLAVLTVLPVCSTKMWP